VSCVSGHSPQRVRLEDGSCLRCTVGVVVGPRPTGVVCEWAQPAEGAGGVSLTALEDGRPACCTPYAVVCGRVCDPLVSCVQLAQRRGWELSCLEYPSHSTPHQNQNHSSRRAMDESFGRFVCADMYADGSNTPWTPLPVRRSSCNCASARLLTDGRYARRMPLCTGGLHGFLARLPVLGNAQHRQRNDWSGDSPCHNAQRRQRNDWSGDSPCHRRSRGFGRHRHASPTVTGGCL
jgi:hypothetical protein